MAFKQFILIFAIFAFHSSKADVSFTIRNNLPGAIWVGILGNSGKPALANGGFVLNEYQETTVNAPDNWAGRFWARTYCNVQSKHCETGDCGNRLECAGNGGAPPATLLEITLKGSGGQDFYDISLVDGYNVLASMTPINGQGQCRSLACTRDINPNCPNDLRLIGSNGQTIGCLSACTKYHTDEYCCAGAHSTPQTCNPDTWQVNSARYFKQYCPDAYSYAYDDQTSTFTCRANAYRITFG